MRIQGNRGWRAPWQFSEIYTCACTKSMAAGAKPLMFQESSRSVFAHRKCRLSEGRSSVRCGGKETTEKKSQRMTAMLCVVLDSWQLWLPRCGCDRNERSEKALPFLLGRKGWSQVIPVDFCDDQEENTKRDALFR